MIVNKTILKRLMKKTYKTGGLTIAKTYNAAKEANFLVIAGSYWTLWIHEGFVPKEIIAAIYELIGILPDEGQMLQCGPERLEEIYPLERSYDIEKNSKELVQEYNVTRLFQKQSDTLLNLLQGPDKRIVAINSIFPEMIETNKDIDKDMGEFESFGPRVSEDGSTVGWVNNVGLLKVYAHYPEKFSNDKELWKFLEGIEIESNEYLKE